MYRVGLMSLLVATFAVCVVESGFCENGPAPDMLRAFPATIAGGVQSEKPATWDTKTVFDYMDGGAELYLRYGLRRLYTTSYKLADQETTVEVYDMGTSKDAFGVFSCELSGEFWPIAQDARYNSGMLRCWQDRFFIKVVGKRDSNDLKHFTYQIAKHLAKQIWRKGALPALASALPSTLKPSDLRYFHCDQELNTFYYVSTENVLELNQETEGVLANCKWKGEPVKGIVIRYPTKAEREKAWLSFCGVVLSPPRPQGTTDGLRIEDVGKGKFAGVRKLANAPTLALCFEAKSVKVCREVLDMIVKGAAR